MVWTGFTLAGVAAVRRGDVPGHRRWMVRGFTMTYAAVALRLWLVVLVPVTGDFDSAYRIVPFLCWVPNLVVAEGLLRRRRVSAPVRPR